eukprot:1070782-Amphidinium_carterae.1
MKDVNIVKEKARVGVSYATTVLQNCVGGVRSIERIHTQWRGRRQSDYQDAESSTWTTSSLHPKLPQACNGTAYRRLQRFTGGTGGEPRDGRFGVDAVPSREEEISLMVAALEAGEEPSLINQNKRGGLEKYFKKASGES